MQWQWDGCKDYDMVAGPQHRCQYWVQRVVTVTVHESLAAKDDGLSAGLHDRTQAIREPTRRMSSSVKISYNVERDAEEIFGNPSWYYAETLRRVLSGGFQSFADIRCTTIGTHAHPLLSLYLVSAPAAI
jgi:hypothetical protein